MTSKEPIRALVELNREPDEEYMEALKKDLGISFPHGFKTVNLDEGGGVMKYVITVEFPDEEMIEKMKGLPGVVEIYPDLMFMPFQEKSND